MKPQGAHVESYELTTGKGHFAIGNDYDKLSEKNLVIGIETTHLENGNGGLSSEHREYLIARHGRADLDPIPSMDPADPLNWPVWKKNINLTLISFHALMTTFTAASIIPAFELFADDFDTTVTHASYLVSLQILVLGFAPLFWKPVSNRFGRRPIWLISTLGSMICNIGCVNSNSYEAQVVTRFLVAFFISPAVAISSAVITETFFASQRGSKMGIWTLMVTLGPPGGPFVMGFVAYHTNGWVWIYRTLAIVNGVQFILYFFLSPETLYIRNGHNPTTSRAPVSLYRQYFVFGKIGQFPLTFRDFWSPLTLFVYPSILIPSIAYSIVFGFASVLLTVEIPDLFAEKYDFNSEQIGLQFIGTIIGSVIGEQLGGFGSDFWMRRKSAGGSRRLDPEYRLWISYFGYITAIIGLVVFVEQLKKATTYNITPIIGIAIAAFGNQVITTVLITYAIDCHHEHAASIGVFINLIRSTWGFIGPFWFPDMFSIIGLTGSGIIMTISVVTLSILPTMLLHWKGAALRERRAQ